MKLGLWCLRFALACLFLAQFYVATPRASAAYATDFSLADHATGQPVRLFDLAGSVLVLDFFSARCTQCQASAPDIRTNIADYFRAAGGNAAGVPVQVISISQWTNNAETDLFIQTNGLELVLDDPDHSVFKQFGGVTYPHFVVVNGVTNGVNYPAWQVLGTTFGYSPSSTVSLLRNYINAVRGTIPPQIRSVTWTSDRGVEFSFNAQRGRTNWLEATTNWVDWVRLSSVTGTNTTQVRDPDAGLFNQRFYRIRVE
jgi:peroxiredoxin